MQNFDLSQLLNLNNIKSNLILLDRKKSLHASLCNIPRLCMVHYYLGNIYINLFFIFGLFKPKFRENSNKIKIGFCFCYLSIQLNCLNFFCYFFFEIMSIFFILFLLRYYRYFVCDNIEHNKL